MRQAEPSAARRQSPEKSGAFGRRFVFPGLQES
jgi:hypothetical protein